MVLTSTHNLCLKQIYEKYQSFLPENFQFLEVKFSIYLNRRVFVMNLCIYSPFDSLWKVIFFLALYGVVGWCEGVVYLTSPGRATDIGLQLGKACYPCSR